MINRKLIVVILIAVVFALMPLIANVLEDIVSQKYESTSNESILYSSENLLLVGCGKSNVGEDCLVVCPTNIYTTVKDILVQINATVFFKHAQPCP